MNDSQMMISVHELRKTYGSHAVLDGLSFQVQRGTIFALLGENGAGKTTTIRILSTLIAPDSGCALINGYDIDQQPMKVKESIRLTGQYAAVDEWLTGEENLVLMGRLNHLGKKEARKRAIELLEQFDLIDAASRQVKTYSGGMRRRLDLAISMIRLPKVLFLDEPTTGLDPRSRNELWTFIRQLADDGVTIFLTTQYLEEADQLADHISIIGGGRIMVEGTAEQLKNIVGDARLVLTFGAKEDLMTAHMILDGQTTPESFSLILPTDGTGDSLRHILNQLHDHGVQPKSVDLQKPTLDDVFMSITSQQKEGGRRHELTV